MRRAARRVLVLALVLAAQSRASGSSDVVAVIAAQDYVAAATASLRASLATHEGRIELRPQGRYADVRIDAAGAVALRAHRTGTNVAAATIVWVDLSVGQRVLRRIPVRFTVQWFKPAWVARRRLAAASALRPDMFEWREVDVARFDGDVVTAFDGLGAKRLRRELDAGGVLVRAAIEDRPPVEAGELIRVTAKVGGVRVQTVAVAARDGFRGEWIAARSRSSGEMLRVEVVGENAAKVQEDG